MYRLLNLATITAPRLTFIASSVSIGAAAAQNIRPETESFQRIVNENIALSLLEDEYALGAEIRPELIEIQNQIVPLTREIRPEVIEIQTQTVQSVPSTRELISLFTSAPPTSTEVSSVLSSLNDRPDLFDSILPSEYKNKSEKMRDAVREGVNLMLNDMSLLNETFSRIERSQAESQPATVCVPTPKRQAVQPNSFTDPESEWEKLHESIETCAICQDLLAGAVILPCEHSFCGICIDKQMQSCCCLEGSTEVVHKCPNDRIEYTMLIYNPVLDNIILQKVTDFVALTTYDKEMKAYWFERRAEYLELLKQGADIQSKQKKVIRQEREAEAAEDDVDEENEFISYAVAIVTGAMLLIIFYCRFRATSK